MHEAVNMVTTNAVQLVICGNVYDITELNSITKLQIAVTFPYAGQNIARRGNSRDYEKTKDSIEQMVNSWFTEYKDGDMSYINGYRHHDQG